MSQVSDFDPVYFELEVDGDVAVARFRKEQMTDDDNLEQFAQELFAVVDQYHFRKVVVCLTPLRHVTSSVLGKLITLHRKLGRYDGRLILCNIHPDLKNVLSTNRLLTYFSTADDVPKSKAAFK